MKRLLFLFSILLTFSLTASGQDTTDTKPYSERIAVLNDTRDTLYVVTNMYSMMLGMWDKPEYDLERPVIIPVRTLTQFRREY